MKEILTSKIHKARVTKANVNYVGSITIDKTLMEKARLCPYQKVMVVSNTTGQRLETYVIEGEQKGEIQINGAAAHLIQEGEEVIILGFSFLEKFEKPCVVLVNEANEFVKYL